MSGRYARGTNVGIDRSRQQIEQVLRRYGASQFAYAWNRDEQQLGFVYQGRKILFRMSPPPDESWRFTPSGRVRSPKDAQKYREQATRSRWRALLLVITAKLEAVEAGITSFDDEFLANLVLPSGETVGQWASPQLDAIVAKTPKALGSGL